MKTRNKVFLGLGTLLAVGISALMITMSYDSPCSPAPTLAAGTESMRAIRQRCYGPSSVLTLERVEKPTPAKGEILVRVHAASVNPFDWHMMTGKPYLVRIFRGFGAPNAPRLGSDFAGTVEAVGPGVTRFKPGDDVFGGAGGAYAEYLVAREDGELAHKPAELSFEQAAAMPIAAVTALQGLRDHGHIAKGQRVLINGASGGVGSFAVQIAKSYGAEVTAVCSTRNLELVSSLGADHVIDYTKENFTEGKERYDLVFDTVGNHGLLALRRVLEPKGTLVSIGGNKKDNWIGPVWGMAKRKIVDSFVDEELAGFIAEITTPDLDYLAGLATEGKLRSVIDKRYPLEETPAALEYIGGRHARGKVVINVE